MGSRYFAASVFAAIISLALTACGGSAKKSTQTTSKGGPETASSAPFDRAFIDAMVPHHRSAITMATKAQGAGLASAELNGVAQDIIDSQAGEIDKMLSWRKAWYGSTKLDPKAGEQLGMSMEEMGMSHGAGDFSHAKDVDAAFATMMTAHHKGAIAMARMALDRAKHPEVKKLARQIIAAQEREIGIMKDFATGDSMGGMKM